MFSVFNSTFSETSKHSDKQPVKVNKTHELPNGRDKADSAHSPEKDKARSRNRNRSRGKKEKYQLPLVDKTLLEKVVTYSFLFFFNIHVHIVVVTM